jgi:hypothetical protein
MYLTKNGERTIFHLDTGCERKDDIVLLAGYKWVTYAQGIVVPARDRSPDYKITYM